MAYPDGFSFIEGPYNIRWSTVSSVATFLIRDPVVMEDVTRTLNTANSSSSAIYGIAMSNAADSVGGPLAARCPVLVPTEQTVFAAKVVTNKTAAQMQIGEVFNLGSDATHVRIDLTSKASARVVLIERGTSGVAYDSADSTVYCQFLKDVIFPFGSNASLKLED